MWFRAQGVRFKVWGLEAQGLNAWDFRATTCYHQSYYQWGIRFPSRGPPLSFFFYRILVLELAKPNTGTTMETTGRAWRARCQNTTYLKPTIPNLSRDTESLDSGCVAKLFINSGILSWESPRQQLPLPAPLPSRSWFSLKGPSTWLSYTVRNT